MDLNDATSRSMELLSISAGAPPGSHANHNHNHNNNNNNNHNHNNNINNNNNNNNNNDSCADSAPAGRGRSPSPTQPARANCCGLLGRLLCMQRCGRGRTATSSVDFALLPAPAPAPRLATVCPAYSYCHANGGGVIRDCSSVAASGGRKLQHRRTPQEIYFESRGTSCKKLLKFNGSSNKILLYPEEGWARTASSSYWTITPCWWQPNRCRIEEFAGTQRHETKAKMVQLEQKGSLLIAGHFRRKRNNNNSQFGSHDVGSAGGGGKDKDRDLEEFKLYLSSNISMEDYNMGYCLTGFVERRCPQTNTFQMTHFAVIKRQWPPSIASGPASGGTKAT